ncbi:hypothetical protein GCM10009680_57670 [Streptomyces yatensis]|uniref:Uncharacterized protein n=1 Tax=Streptomyces yatensis TaxID=155177 RepID=A0ABP4UP21_9ACTN
MDPGTRSLHEDRAPPGGTDVVAAGKPFDIAVDLQTDPAAVLLPPTEMPRTQLIDPPATAARTSTA